MSDLAAILAEVTLPTPGPKGEIRYRVRAVGGSQAHFFGRDSNGYASLLLNASDAHARAPIRLAALDVQFSLPCAILDESHEERTQVLTAVVCRSTDQLTSSYFAHIAGAITALAGPTPSSNEVAEIVRRLVDLFQHLARPAIRPVAGLFAELFVIHLSRSPRSAIAAWRSRVDNRFDFSAADARLEVKSAADRARAHFFSREQCAPPPGTVGALLSLFVESSGGGLSIEGLVQRIEGQIDGDPDLVLRLNETIAETLGEDMPRALLMRFDEHLARSSLQAYKLSEVPAVRVDLPSEVSQVRFRSDISRVPTASVAELGIESAALRDLLPSRL